MVKSTAKNMTAQNYTPRFIRMEHVPELINIWHTSRVYSGSRYERMCYTAKKFHEAHPEYTQAGAYKDLECLIS